MLNQDLAQAAKQSVDQSVRHGEVAVNSVDLSGELEQIARKCNGWNRPTIGELYSAQSAILQEVAERELCGMPTGGFYAEWPVSCSKQVAQ